MKRSSVISGGVLLGAIFLCAGVVWAFTRPASSGSEMERRTVSLPGGALLLELPRTPEQFAQGLGERDRLAPETGMLFLFPTPGRYAFWMKGMRFSLDIVFLRDGVVTQIAPRLPPPPRVGEAPVTAVPTELMNEVLEVGAGEASARGWAVGMRLFQPDSLH